MIPRSRIIINDKKIIRNSNTKNVRSLLEISKSGICSYTYINRVSVASVTRFNFKPFVQKNQNKGIISRVEQKRRK